jgi:dTMP kinase
VPGRGLFVAFEGGEGAGKSTQVRRLFDWLGLVEVPARVTHEPGGTAPGARIRALLLDPASAGLSPRAEALLYAADRAHHVATLVRPALERGEVVLQDRYLDSSVAYQGAGRVLEPGDVRGLSLWAAEGLLPDLTLLLDVDAATARDRRSTRTRYDRLEAEHDDFHERVRQAYRRLAEEEPDRFAVVDGGLPVDEVEQRIRAAVAPLLDR